MTHPIVADNNKKLIHNLERVADEIILSISDMERVRELVHMVVDADTKYDGPWYLRWLYRYTRLRHPENAAMMQELNQAGSPQEVIEIVDRHLSNGGYAFNTYFLIELTLGLSGYSDTRNAFSLKADELIELRKLVLQRTGLIVRPPVPAKESTQSIDELNQQAERKQKLEADLQLAETRQTQAAQLRKTEENLLKFELLRKIELERELQLLPRRNIPNAAAELAASTVFAKKTNDVNKLSVSKYGLLKSKLERHYGSLTGKKPQMEAAAMKKVGKLDPKFLQEMNKQLETVYNGAALDYYSTLELEAKLAANPMFVAPIQTAEPKLCAAAYEAPVVSAPITGEAKEMVFTSEQSAAMMRLFGSAQKIKTGPKEKVTVETASPVTPK